MSPRAVAGNLDPRAEADTCPDGIESVGARRPRVPCSRIPPHDRLPSLV